MAVFSYDPEGQHDPPVRSQERNGYHALLLALLDDVFQTACVDIAAFYHQRDRVKQRERDREWLLSPADYPFSFVWTCQHLGVDPHTVRAAYFAGVHWRAKLPPCLTGEKE